MKPDPQAAYCQALWQTPVELQATYRTPQDAPQVAQDCWNAPFEATIALVHLDGWESPVRPTLTPLGEMVAATHYLKRHQIPPFAKG